jgi:hypothetical protein
VSTVWLPSVNVSVVLVPSVESLTCDARARVRRTSVPGQPRGILVVDAVNVKPFTMVRP